MSELVCNICGAVFPEESITLFDRHYLCPDCLSRNTVICYECGERLWNHGNYGSDARPLCESCYSEHYTRCTRCNRLIRVSDAYYPDGSDDPYCDDCCDDDDGRVIHDYSYKPTPIFYGTGPRYFGVELEIDEGGEYNANAEKLLNVGNACSDHIYIKHDGSLDDGFEIVTEPMSLAYHMEDMPWEDVLSKATAMGYRSHSARTCGLHIHISRNTFGPSAEQQDEPIGKLLYLVEKFWNELLSFSRRTSRQLERWAARYAYRDKPADILKLAKGCANRYTCVNLTNPSTVELRIFRGTLKYNTLIATLQLVNHLCDLAIYSSDEDLKNLSWCSFVSGVTEPELIRYLKERRLYLNEPVAVSEEV